MRQTLPLAVALASGLSFALAIVLGAQLAPLAQAAKPLSPGQRRQILRTAHLRAPNGKRLRKPACIGGRLACR